MPERSAAALRTALRAYRGVELRPAEEVLGTESDTLLRTEDQLIDEAVRELGFQRRGKKIVAALERATGSACRSG